MDDLMHDVRYASRLLRRTPGFTAVAVLCLAVGLGINAAAFGVLDALLFRDLPGVRQQNQLNTVLISHDFAEGGRSNAQQFSTADWEIMRGGIPAFSTMGLEGSVPLPLRVGGEPLAVRCDFVSGDLFATLGTRPAVGRLLNSRDDVANAPPVAVISYEYWQSDFDGRSDIVGQSLSVSDKSFTIVGVTPKGFVGLYPGEMDGDKQHGSPYAFLPVAAAPLVRVASRYATPNHALDDQWLVLVGRRRPDASEAQVHAQARATAARISATYPRERARADAEVRSATTASTVEEIAGVVAAMALPALILLVACANLANQLLARGIQRSGEIAVRLSLGATRARIVRLLLVETTLLALAASVAGLFVARVLVDALGAFALVLPFRIPIDTRVFVFSAALAVVTGAVFGLVPALRATRLDLARAVNEGSGSGGFKRSRLRDGLVVLQVAASVAMLALSGVFVRAAQQSHVIDTLHNSNRLLTVSINFDLLGYTEAARRDLQSRALERFRALPNVEAVSIATFSPLTSIPERRVSVIGDGQKRGRWQDIAAVRGDWFATWNLRPLSGRLLTDAELRGEQSVVVIDSMAATELLPGKNAIGQSLRIGDSTDARIVTVVGVVRTMDKPRHEAGGMITLAASAFSARPTFYLRARGDAAALRPTVRAIMRELDPHLPVLEVATYGESLDLNAAPVTQLAQGAGGMGLVALLLAALGLSSVLAFVVEQRRREIGVRVALGAESGTITRMILRQSLKLVGIGIFAGALIAAGAATGLRSILFGLSPINPAAFVGSTAIMLVVALLSSVVPARRAAKVDPMVALRSN